MKNQVKTWVDDELFALIMDIVGNGSVANFLREAIQDKIHSLQQKRKDISSNISNSNIDTKQIENMINEVSTMNKVLFEQVQKQQELLKLILRRASSSSLNVIALMSEIAPKIDQSSIGDQLAKILTDDLSKLHIWYNNCSF